MSTSTQLTPIQAGAAIALGFGLNLSAVAAEFDIHRSTLHNWMKDPVFAVSVQSAQQEFQIQFRTQLAMLTRRALETLQEILADPEVSPSVRLRAALAVLKQDWKLPPSTDFDTVSPPEDSPRNEFLMIGQLSRGNAIGLRLRESGLRDYRGPTCMPGWVLLALPA